MTVLLVALPLLAGAGGTGPALLLLGILALGPASDLAMALVNRVITGMLGPAAFPRLELKDGVPPEMRTLVVVPTLLVSEPDVEEQVRRLEIHFLGNPDGDVRFALLSDWLDAPAARVDGDDELLSAAAAAIDRLNARHGEAPGGGARFLLFHRRRRWNEVEGRWMGWERKRGKLHELNDLLRGSRATDILTSGRPESTPPEGIRYVVTLDADTRLPRGAVTRLVGTIAHPLNRPRLDPASGRVTRGYGILQPRITPTLPAERNASVFQRVYSGPAGIDPYSSAVSDVYQDLFGEGSYTGKGIYDVDAFSRAMEGRVPENTLLSHDLFEGTFARAGLVTDVELFDEFPSHYLEAAARQHRWARGDWQLLPWILGRARGADGARVRWGIPGLARWKMLDNLRRTMSAPLTVATLVVAWTVPSVPALAWTALVVVALVIPAAFPIVDGLLPRRKGISKRSHLRGIASDIAIGVTQVGLDIVLLAHQAALMADAIVRTLARLAITRRNLLEWTTASQTKGSLDLDLPGFYRRMAGGVLIAAGSVLMVVLLKPEALVVSLPFVVLWLLSPAIARWVSLPPPAVPGRQLSAVDAQSLRLLGRRTWRFFEEFVGPGDHALPPDNVQEEPQEVIAHRTSPTNIGMYLLTVMTARDFGWIGTLDAIERLEATLATIARLERHRGHLYNWYDTRDLRPLDSPYVSSVDSGNLCAALLVVANGCYEMLDQPLPTAAALAGIQDALELTSRAAASMGDGRRTQTLGLRNLAEALAPFADTPTADTPYAWVHLLDRLGADSRTLADVASALTAERGDPAGSELDTWAGSVHRTVESHARDVALLRPVIGDDRGEAVSAAFPTLGELLDMQATDEAGEWNVGVAVARRLSTVSRRAMELFTETEFEFLFDPTRKLFSIGYRVADGSLDPSYYDMLASEARTTSFLAIAKGDVPVEHWFHLGRALTPVGRGSALISWSGSMFEYLMPALVMDAPAGSLLDQTYALVVARQVSYAAERGVPWGISESAFNARDLERTYQYSSFGIPGLGLKRGLAEDVVIAPYATALAAMVQPGAAVANLARLGAAGASGRYGLHEALDYTARRLPEGETVAVVRSYMAHHQGMMLVAIGNVLNERPMVRRFHAAPLVQATELLLQERMPRDVLVARPRADEVKSAAEVRDLVPPVLRRFTSPHDQTPRTHLLSNGRYAVMVTAAGSGYSRWGDLAVTRWREDVTRDAWGSYLFLRDTGSGAVWSAGHQPTGVEADSYDVRYSEEHAEFSRRDGSIVTAMTVVVSGENDAEIRRVSLTNLGSQDREIELTSYAEIVLAPLAADLAHPAFQNLFVQTEYVPEIGVLLATRRPRSNDERQVWAAHVLVVEDQAPAPLQYETDRARFLGRGRTVRTAVSVLDGRPLSNTVGAVLDPIFSLRCRVSVAAGETAHVTFSTVVAESRPDVLDLADKYRENATFERAATLAWTQAQVQLRHLGIEGDEAHLFQRLANRVLYSDLTLRPAPSVLARNERGAPGLWAHGISGDLPIVLVRIDQVEDVDIVRQLLRAHEYWRLKLLDVDLVIINEHGLSYAQELQDVLETAVRTSQSAARPEHSYARGRVYVLRGEHLSQDDRTMLQAVARAVLLSRGGTLADQVLRLERPARAARARHAPAVRRELLPVTPSRPELEFFNGLGGFAEGGREYVTVLGPGQSTPAPWLNVIANETFGFTVSESGSGYTWSGNSRENQLTPWSNDPVSDPPGEAIYVRDDEDGALWSATALPIRDEDSTYVARHGMGYSRFEHERDGVRLDLVQFVPADEPVKVSVLTIENRSGRSRRLSVTAFAEWALGPGRAASAPHIVTSLDAATGAILARNAWNTEFAGRVAFLDLGGRQTSWTADRTEFLGRNGALDRPSGLDRSHRLKGAAGAGLDPCAVLQTGFVLPDGGRTQVVVLLGEADGAAAAAQLIARSRAADHATTLRSVRTRWDASRGQFQVRTPDRAMDILLNRWLLYQTLSCRIWARTAFYQAGGAFGFRDQLQDVMALTTARPDLRAGAAPERRRPPVPRGGRAALVASAVGSGRAHAFFGRPALAARTSPPIYVEVTGDASVLDEMVPFIEGPPLRPARAEVVHAARGSRGIGILFEHCARALDASLAVGRARSAPDGRRRLERRHEPGRPAGPRRERVAGLVPACILGAFRRFARRAATEPRAQPLACACGSSEAGPRARWLGRRLVPPGVLRRRHAARLRPERRMPDRLHRPVVGVLSGAADRSAHARAMAASRNPGPARGRAGPALHAAVRQAPAYPGYIKGYLPGHPRERRPVHPRAPLDVLAFAALGDGDGRGALLAAQPHQPRRHAGGRASYKVEPYVVAADVYGCRRTSGGAAGPGTPGRRAGCTGPASSRSSGSACAGRPSRSRPPSRAHGPGTRSTSAITRAATRSSSRTRTGSAAGSPRPGWTGSPSMGLVRRSHSPVTARRTACGSCSGKSPPDRREAVADTVPRVPRRRTPVRSGAPWAGPPVGSRGARRCPAVLRSAAPRARGVRPRSASPVTTVENACESSSCSCSRSARPPSSPRAGPTTRTPSLASSGSSRPSPRRPGVPGCHPARGPGEVPGSRSTRTAPSRGPPTATRSPARTRPAARTKSRSPPASPRWRFCPDETRSTPCSCTGSARRRRGRSAPTA